MNLVLKKIRRNSKRRTIFMARENKNWHPDFVQYIKDIVSNPIYRGLPIQTKSDGSYAWLASKLTDTGKGRIEWCSRKADELGIVKEPGFYAKVMLEIHPLKRKPCQICGKWMSLYYHYPSANFVRFLNKEFDTDFTMNDHISDIYDSIVQKQKTDRYIKAFLIKKGKLVATVNNSKDEIISELERKCRIEGQGSLGPGAMSNFPDRYDGFHSYNRCCRSSEDKGRSKENLKSYTQDRRAYEYWSDGNIHAANQFMGSSFFKGISADHIGPISLGVVHDPRYLQPMAGSDNSSKRDRLSVEDVKKIIEVRNRTKIVPISWYSIKIWDFIEKNYQKNEGLVPDLYRDTLKQNMTNFMFILGVILDIPEGDLGAEFLEEVLLKPKYDDFNYSYSFNERGEIVSNQPRHFTDRSNEELDRYKRIAFESVKEYNSKENRNLSPDLTMVEKQELKNLVQGLMKDHDFSDGKKRLSSLMSKIQDRLLERMKSASR